MKNVVILLLENCTPIASIGAMELLYKAGVIHQQIHRTDKPFFDIQLASVGKVEVQTSNGVAITCHRPVAEIQATDLLLIPAIDFDIDQKLEANQKVIPHIKRLYDQGTEVASMCTGTFLLASTGILNGLSATTHWFMANKFKNDYPEVDLKHEKVVIDNGNVYCSGGATSFMSLILYLIEKFCGKETSTMASKMLLIDTQFPQQSQFSIFTPQLSHNDHAIKEAQEYIEKHRAERVSTAALAGAVGLSERTLIRRFKQATGDTPYEYIQRTKIEAAKRMLETEKHTVEEVMYSLGYNDKNSFRKAFVKHAGLNPSHYRSKYSLST
ncbi:MAG: helix-turn-helix domain-containing protein [Bacteroidota bacterium]